MLVGHHPWNKTSFAEIQNWGLWTIPTRVYMHLSSNCARNALMVIENVGLHQCINGSEKGLLRGSTRPQGNFPRQKTKSRWSVLSIEHCSHLSVIDSSRSLAMLTPTGRSKHRERPSSLACMTQFTSKQSKFVLKFIFSGILKFIFCARSRMDDLGWLNANLEKTNNYQKNPCIMIFWYLRLSLESEQPGFRALAMPQGD